MAKLVPSITTLSGSHVVGFSEFEDLEVDVPLSDARLAKVTLSIYDPAIGLGGSNIAPLKRMLKVRYLTDEGDHLVFWGRIILPDWDAEAGTVTINCHGPTFMLKKHYHRFGDFVVGTRTVGGYSLDPAGVYMLHESAIPIAGQLARGIPHPGIYMGIFGAPRLHYVGNAGPSQTVTTGPGNGNRPVDIEKPLNLDAVWRLVERGTNVQESLDTVLQAAELGFDIDWKPVDAAHPPTWSHPSYAAGAVQNRTWQPGYYAQVDVRTRQGVDRSSGAGAVLFHHNFGLDNLDGFKWGPDGDAVKNYSVYTYPGGERNSKDSARLARAHVEDSWLQYGILGAWDSTVERDTQSIIEAKAKATVGAYGYPPDFFEIVVKTDEQARYHYGDDFAVGDTIHAACRKGFMTPSLNGRIMRARLRQQTARRAARVELECVPAVLTSDSQITVTEST